MRCIMLRITSSEGAEHHVENAFVELAGAAPVRRLAFLQLGCVGLEALPLAIHHAANRFAQRAARTDRVPKLHGQTAEHRLGLEIAARAADLELEHFRQREMLHERELKVAEQVFRHADRGVLMYGVTPPRSATTAERADEIAGVMLERLRPLDLDALIAGKAVNVLYEE